MHGRGSEQAKRSKRRRVGYTFLYVAIDDYSRVAYVEAHDYNCHRHHTAVGGPPASRAHNLTRTDI